MAFLAHHFYNDISHSGSQKIPQAAHSLFLHRA